MPETYLNKIAENLLYLLETLRFKKKPQNCSLLFYTLVTPSEHDRRSQQKHNNQQYNEIQTQKIQTMSGFP